MKINTNSWTPKDIVHFDAILQTLSRVTHSFSSFHTQDKIYLLSVYFLLICARHVCQNLFLYVEDFNNRITPFILKSISDLPIQAISLNSNTEYNRDHFPTNNYNYPNLSDTIPDQVYDPITLHLFLTNLWKQLKDADKKTSKYEASTKLVIAQLINILAAAIMILNSIANKKFTPKINRDLARLLNSSFDSNGVSFFT